MDRGSVSWAIAPFPGGSKRLNRNELLTTETDEKAIATTLGSCLEKPADQDEGHDHGGGFEIEVRASGGSLVDTEQERHAGPGSNQRVHGGRAVSQIARGDTKEIVPGSENDDSGKNDLHQHRARAAHVMP